MIRFQRLDFLGSLEEQVRRCREGWGAGQGPCAQSFRHSERALASAGRRCAEGARRLAAAFPEGHVP